MIPHDQGKERHSPALPLIALFGPTAVGKTEIALATAERLRRRGENPVAISADALQVYRGLEILTGAASTAQQKQLEHRLISFIPIDKTFSAAEFARLAHNEIDTCVGDGRRPIIVGGTGLYLRAALTELDFRPPPAPQARAHWQEQLDTNGPAHLHELLTERAGATAAAIAPSDGHRLIRAHELLDAGVQPPATVVKSQLWTQDMRLPTVLCGLTMDREALDRRIDQRVDAMIASGAIDEVKRAHANGVSVTASKALGFKELLAGDHNAMKITTRQYSRRQLTWMRKLAGVHMIDLTDRGADDVAQEIVGLIDDVEIKQKIGESNGF